MKATVAPPTAVFRQPKWSVNMLTTGEQRKIIPIARAPTQAGEEEQEQEEEERRGGERRRRIRRRGRRGGGNKDEWEEREI